MHLFVRCLCVAILVAASSLAIAQDNKIAESTVYQGYWRLGFNTAANPLQEASDSQGEHKIFYDVPTTRIARSPSYFYLRVIKTFENGVQAGIKVDHEGNTPHGDNNWGDAEEQILRVRDLWLALPISNDSHIWAGARTMEWEDIRLFDNLNHFDINAHGVGAKVGNTQFFASFSKDKVKPNLTDAAGNPLTNPPPTGEVDTDGNPINGDDVEVNRKNVTLFGRHEMMMGSNTMLKPMVKVVQYGPTAKDDHTKPDVVREDSKGSQDISVGGVLSQWGDGFWANTHFWIDSLAVDKSGAQSGHNRNIGVGESANVDFGSWGVLMALWGQHETFHDSQAVYKIENGTLVRDGDKTTKAITKLSIGAQPVYYATDKLHVALDMNVTKRSQYVQNWAADAVLLSPVLRYTPSKNTIGNPQIYTSVTYGKYDWKSKTALNGDKVDNLITTQTGLEVWF